MDDEIRYDANCDDEGVEEPGFTGLSSIIFTI